MARRADFYTTVGDGANAQSVGYSVADRGTGFLGVRFTGPAGERLEKMTDCKKKDANYHISVSRIIATVSPSTMALLARSRACRIRVAPYRPTIPLSLIHI